MSAQVPPLSVSDTIKNLRLYEIYTSEEQFRRPSPEFVEMVFYGCLKQITGIDADALRVPAMEAIDVLVDAPPELYQNALVNSMMQSHMEKVARDAGILDFTSMDLARPTQNRTQLIVEHLINFMRFIDEWAEPHINEVKTRSEALVKERDDMKINLQEMETRKAAVMQARARDQPKCDQLKAEAGELGKVLLEYKDMQEKRAAAIEERRLQRTEHSEKATRLNERIQALNENINDLRSRIVQSPARIKSTIVAMSSKATEKKRALTMYEARTRELQAKITAFQKIEKDVRGAISQLEKIEKEVEKLEASSKALTEVTDQFNTQQSERRGQRGEYERGQMLLANAEDKLGAAREHLQHKKQEAQNESESLKDESQRTTEERRKNDEEIKEIEAEAIAIESEMTKHRREVEKELEELLEWYHKLKHEAEVYVETLARPMKLKVTRTN